MTDGLRITRLRIHDYRGIADLDTPVTEHGAIIKGGSATGKTSVLRAIEAALAARDIGPDAIKHGADEAEIFVELDALSVRRRIDANGTDLKATTAIPHSKQRAEIKQKRLSELFPGGLNPLALFRATPAERRKIVLAALPLKLESKHLEEWLTAEQRATFPPPLVQALPTMHPLEAVAAIHKHLYDLRAAANVSVKDATRTVEHGAKLCDACPLPATVTVVPSLGNDWQPTVEATDRVKDLAESALKEAQHAADMLETKARMAADDADRTEATRQRIADWRQAAKEARGKAPPQWDDAEAVAARDAAQEKVERARADLAAAEADLRKACNVITAGTAQNMLRRDDLGHAARGDERADELEALANASVTVAPTAEEMAAVATTLRQAAQALVDAREAVKAVRLRADQVGLISSLARFEEVAQGLTATVDFLRTGAATQLMKESEGIPGLALDDEQELTIDGTRLEARSGSEQLALCVDIAKRAALQRGGEGRVIVTDGLEALDDERLRAFVRMATSGGWQLIGTRVTGGDLTFEAIEVAE